MVTARLCETARLARFSLRAHDFYLFYIRRGGEWSFKKVRVSQNFSRFSLVSQSRLFSGVLQSRIFNEAVSKSRLFDNAVLESRPVFGFLFADFDRLCSKTIDLW